MIYYKTKQKIEKIYSNNKRDTCAHLSSIHRNCNLLYIYIYKWCIKFNMRVRIAHKRTALKDNDN